MVAKCVKNTHQNYLTTSFRSKLVSTGVRNIFEPDKILYNRHRMKEIGRVVVLLPRLEVISHLSSLAKKNVIELETS